MTTDSAENVFDIKERIRSTCADIKDTTVPVLLNQSFTVMGVLAPAKLKDSYVFDQYKDDIKITNRMETLAYTFTSGESVIEFEKPVYLSRKNVEVVEGTEENFYCKFLL